MYPNMLDTSYVIFAAKNRHIPTKTVSIFT